jgi:hypothetical protein
MRSEQPRSYNIAPKRFCKNYAELPGISNGGMEIKISANCNLRWWEEDKSVQFFFGLLYFNPGFVNGSKSWLDVTILIGYRSRTLAIVFTGGGW